MLQAIRDNAQGWIAWVIVGLIILTFALFGIDQYARGDKIEVIAEVNGEEITGREFVSMYNRQQQRLQQQFGDLYEQVVNENELRQQVLDALVESEQIRQWAEDNNMAISDQQLATAIQSADVFQQDGEFSQKIYEDILLRNGLNVARFEYEQRQFLIENQFKNLTLASSFATPSEVKQLAELQGQERHVSYLRVDQRPFLKTVEVTDEQVEAAYQENLTDYVEPEKVSIDYIEISQKVLAEQVAVDEEILQGFYQQNQLQFTLPEKRQAKHILIAVNAATDEADQKARQTLEEVQKKLQAGEAFESLAKQYSDDPGSAESGGDLGMFEQGMMVPEFDEAVFSMKVGEVSEPVRTEFGYHLIKLVDIQEKQSQPFDAVKAEVEQMYKMQEAERQYFDVLEQVNTLAYEQPDSLEPVADALGLEVKTSPFFGKAGASGAILSNTKVINTAFSEEVLKSKLNSASIDIATNHAVVIRVNEYKEARQKTLDEVASTIKSELVRKAAIAESAKLGEELMAKIEQGEAPESLMRDGIEWNTVGWIQRSAQNLLPQMVSEAFKTPKPVDGKPSWNRFALTTGDTILMRVSEVKNAEITQEQQEALQLAFKDLYAGAEMAARLAALQQGSEVVVKEKFRTIK